MRTQDWTGFARGYNGPQHARHDYAGRLRRAYARWAKIADTPRSPEAEIVHVPVPTPAPRGELPAPVGHNGRASALSAATGHGPAVCGGEWAGLGVLVVAPALALMVRFGWILADVANDPETVVQLTALALAGAVYARAWLAPKNAGA